MMNFPLPLTQLIFENLSVIMTFAFSRGSLELLVEERRQGEWRYLKKSVLEISEERAIKSCIELAIYLRALDDEVCISKFLRQHSGHSFGTFISSDGSTKCLNFREVANKIIHTAKFNWEFPVLNQPMLVCTPRVNQKWRHAQIDLVAVTVLCGEFLS